MDAIQPPTYEESVDTPLLERRRPSVHLRDIVEKYMQSKRSGLDGSLHPALNTNDPRVKLDPNRHKWVETEIEEVDLESLYKDVDAEQKQFLDAIAYYDSHAEPKYKVGINMEESHSMEDVIKAIDDAKKAYDEKGEKGFFGPIRKAFRKLGDNEGAGKAWLGLLPGESHYFSIICGGIKLILGAAGRLRVINTEIVNALVKIPAILNQSRRTLDVHRISGTLRDLSSGLYVAVLHTMGHILQYYQQRAIPKAIKVFGSQGSFETTLLEKIAMIVQCSDAIDKEAESCDRELLKETNLVVKRTKLVTESTYERTGFLQDSVGIISSTLTVREQAAMERAQEATRRHDELLLISQEQCKINQAQSALLTEVLNGVKVLLEKSPQLSELVDEKGNPTPEATPTKLRNSSKADTRAAQKNLMSRLSYDKDSPRADMRANLRHAMSLTQEDQDRAVFMMQSELLQNWLITTKSSALLVNGGAYNSGSQNSPLSFVCAKLSNALRQARKSGSAASKSSIIDLHFFCGEHGNWRDSPDNGPAGVLNSLLAQLLTRYQQFNLNQIKRLSKLNPDDVTALSRIFGSLLAQLPSPIMVFCIIDNLQCYADEQKEYAEIMLSKLISLTRQSEGRCIFKLLITVPIELQLYAVDDFDEEEEVLRIPERLEKRGGFTDMKWDMGAGQDIADRFGQSSESGLGFQ